MGHEYITQTRTQIAGHNTSHDPSSVFGLQERGVSKEAMANIETRYFANIFSYIIPRGVRNQKNKAIVQYIASTSDPRVAFSNCDATREYYC